MAEQLKHLLFNKTALDLLIKDFKSVYPSFDSKKFTNLVFDKSWENLELKERMHHIALCLHKVLPEDFPEALSVILKVAKEKLPKRKTGFLEVCLPDYVETYGIDYPEISLDALAVLTQYPTSEWAVRPFILKYPDKTLKKFYEWCKSGNHHVRRFSSEGCRPRLPWGMAIPQFKKDPSPIMPIIETLMNDPSEYVRKSVANNLNDISKDNPKLFLEFVIKWHGKSEHTEWILKHASRTLLKKGDKTALAFFGFDGEKKVKINKFTLKPAKVKIGDKLSFSFTIKNDEPKDEKLRLEYKIYYVKSNGKLSSKIFKISENMFEPGKEYAVIKKQSFKNMTTRKHFKGKHKISIVVNGIEKAEKMFEVI